MLNRSEINLNEPTNTLPSRIISPCLLYFSDSAVGGVLGPLHYYSQLAVTQLHHA